MPPEPCQEGSAGHSGEEQQEEGPLSGKSERMGSAEVTVCASQVPSGLVSKRALFTLSSSTLVNFLLSTLAWAKSRSFDREETTIIAIV